MCARWNADGSRYMDPIANDCYGSGRLLSVSMCVCVCECLCVYVCVNKAQAGRLQCAASSRAESRERAQQLSRGHIKQVATSPVQKVDARKRRFNHRETVASSSSITSTLKRLTTNHRSQSIHSTCFRFDTLFYFVYFPSFLRVECLDRPLNDQCRRDCVCRP